MLQDVVGSSDHQDLFRVVTLFSVAIRVIFNHVGHIPVMNPVQISGRFQFEKSEAFLHILDCIAGNRLVGKLINADGPDKWVMLYIIKAFI